MSKEKPTATSTPNQKPDQRPQTPTPPPSKPGDLSPGKVAPLFRRVDWLTLLLTFAAVWIGYYFTLAPELTLEDSGELATGSFYAGIPHPPGYPVWTIYTWFWAKFLPFSNVAWRVALGEATAAALAAGLLGFLVSRGSSLLMEGIEDLKAMSGKWESAICMISGFVAGTLLGYNGFMWSQSVIVEVYSFSVLSFVIVMLFLLRWIYAPHQRRYLYLALFFHGICFTNHQTLIVAAMGIEVAIAAADFRMGRYLWLGNSIIYLAGLLLKSQHILTALENNQAIFTIFNVVGICSIAAYFWFSFLTKESFQELCLDFFMAAFCLLVASKPAIGPFAIVLALGALAGWAYYARQTWKLGLEWIVVIVCGICWIVGALFYFYMPLAGMTNPPMQWGYPRTIEGFIHAFTRGQYEKANPTDIIGDPLRFVTQLGMLGRGIIDEFNWVYALIALVPFLFFPKLHRRERAWLLGVGAIYLCLGVLLLILLNPPPDRAAQELVRVFFTASHTMIALLVGYGLTLIAAYMATHYQRFRSWGLIGGVAATFLALFSFVEITQETFFGQAASVSLSKLLSFVGQVFSNKDQYGLPVYAGLILIAMAVAFLAGVAVYRQRAPLAITLAVFALMPLHPFLTHWSDNEQRNHYFGYWFGHDMFTPPFADTGGKPLYPQMTKDAVLYGGTDPGRFCPTYMIFCDSFIPGKCQPKEDQNFDRRDVYIITQNALADGTYLNYIRAQYNRSAQIDPPFFQELLRSEKERTDNYTTNVWARAARPLDRLFTNLGDNMEKERRTFTSWLLPADFTDLNGFTTKLASAQDPVSKFILEQLRPGTRQLLGKGDQKQLRQALADDLNVLIDRELKAKNEGKTVEPLYTAERFNSVALSEYLQDFVKENPQSHTRVRLNRLLLEAAYPNMIAASKGGVYPDREMYIATPDDSGRCFQDYLIDAQRRLQHDTQLPNEPRQIKPGEDVRIVENRVQVSGQVAVMAINGLLTKVMFDHNPKNEFFVEESFPLDWMYPHLTPFGVIMKINRQPLAELTDDIVNRDHTFWSKYSERLIGDWITYDTSVKEIAQFVEKVYLRRDFSGFKGDRKFVRDDQAQKAFSKLRSSIGGVYNYRINSAKPGSTEQQRMIKEADFAFRQAFAFCPYSPEAVFRYVNLLLSMQRFDDALVVATTCLTLDPYNGQVMDLVKRLKAFREQVEGLPAARAAAAPQNIQVLENTLKANPANFQASITLAAALMQQQQTNRAAEVLDRMITNAQIDANSLLAAAQFYAQWGDFVRLEAALERLVKVVPDSPEAWYDLAALKTTLGRTAEVVPTLQKALALSAKRRTTDPTARDLAAQAQGDPRFAPVRQLPEIQALLKPGTSAEAPK